MSNQSTYVNYTPFGASTQPLSSTRNEKGCGAYGMAGGENKQKGQEKSPGKNEESVKDGREFVITENGVRLLISS